MSLKGINYLVKPNFPKSTKFTPAAGIAYYQQNQIKILVYVKATNSYIWETACGSGSLAFFLITNKPKVIQPSGETITIRQINDKLIIKTPLKEIYEK